MKYCDAWKDKLLMIHETALDEGAKLAGELKRECMPFNKYAQVVDDLKDLAKVIGETFEVIAAVSAEDASAGGK